MDWFKLCKCERCVEAQIERRRNAAANSAYNGTEMAIHDLVPRAWKNDDERPQPVCGDLM